MLFDCSFSFHQITGMKWRCNLVWQHPQLPTHRPHILRTKSWKHIHISYTHTHTCTLHKLHAHRDMHTHTHTHMHARTQSIQKRMLTEVHSLQTWQSYTAIIRRKKQCKERHTSAPYIFLSLQLFLSLTLLCLHWLHMLDCVDYFSMYSL